MRKSFRLLTLLVPIATSPAFAVGPGVGTTGPDVTINLLDTMSNYGGSGGFVGYAVGTTSCNIGDEPLNWCDDSGGCTDGIKTITNKQHPVIAQGLYRIADGRVTQVGMSWLKHGFFATNTTEGQCKVGQGCAGSPMGSDQLGVGCRDTYWADLNGTRPLGKRSEVNPTTGVFPFPYSNVGASNAYAQRIKVATSDVDPSQNADATYWIEGQYVADNDAAGGNGLNNASYRRVTVAPGSFDLSLQDSIVRERSALHAWAAADASVEMHNVDLIGTIVERFEVARKVTQVDGDTWHYEIAVRNMNSNRAANSFQVDFEDGTPIANVGWQGVAHHSGEPYSTAAWDSAATQATGTVFWGTASFASDPNANALRWATLFNFWFDADVAQGDEIYTIGLFKPGSTDSISWTWPLFADGFESHNFVAWELGFVTVPDSPVALAGN